MKGIFKGWEDKLVYCPKCGKSVKIKELMHMGCIYCGFEKDELQKDI